MIPGPKSRALLAALARYEARGVTYVSDEYPIVWERAQGVRVHDVDGNPYLDLTSAFGVANVGHTNPAVAAAIAAQAQRLIHGMGDVHPAQPKIALLEKLAAIAPGDLRKTYFASGGAEAVEFALKTAWLATRKPRVLAFRGGYHGLSLGTLPANGLERFRTPFAPILGHRVTFVPFPAPLAEAEWSLAHSLAAVEAALTADPDIGAVLVEPVQGRAGVVLPPPGFLAGLRALCDRSGAVLIFDEIYTGFARTGTFFACQAEAVVPDLLCIGKAMGNGVPISAVIGTPAVMDAWQPSTGEALVTSTYLGNPLCCAAVLATIGEIERRDLVARATTTGATLGARLQRFRDYPVVRDVRGRGMLWGIALENAAQAEKIVHRGLANGLILLQSGIAGDVLTIAPPLVIEPEELERALGLLDTTFAQVLAEVT